MLRGHTLVIIDVNPQQRLHIRLDLAIQDPGGEVMYINQDVQDVTRYAMYRWMEQQRTGSISLRRSSTSHSLTIDVATVASLGSSVLYRAVDTTVLVLSSLASSIVTT